MSQPGAIQPFLRHVLAATLQAAGNPFGSTANATITLAVPQRKQIVAGHAALTAELAGVEAEQLIADELATLCHKLTSRGGKA